MNPLRVLLVTYSFPPAGGVGILRAASLARYLPSENIRLDVLTARNPSAVGADLRLLADIPQNVTIHRTLTLDLPFALKKYLKKIAGGSTANSKLPGKSPAQPPNLLKRIAQDILLPDPQVTWLPIVTRSARKIVRDRCIDIVLITVPPFSALLLVKHLRKLFPDLPIVVDFRDEWLSTTLDLVSFSRSQRARSIARRVEAAAVKCSSAVVMVTDTARHEIRERHSDEPENKFFVVPNGFDVTRVCPPGSPRMRHPGNKIVVSHIGTLYGSTDPTILVEALQSLPPAIKSRFKFRFTGHIEEQRFHRALAELGGMIEMRDYVPQHEALASLASTDYLLLISHDPINVGAKFYDYVGAGKPILGLVRPQGETRCLLEKMRAGWWADDMNVQNIARLFIDAATRIDSLDREFQPDRQAIAKYERKPLALRYAQLLHAVASRPYASGHRAIANNLAGE